MNKIKEIFFSVLALGFMLLSIVIAASAVWVIYTSWTTLYNALCEMPTVVCAIAGVFLGSLGAALVVLSCACVYTTSKLLWIQVKATYEEFTGRIGIW